MNNQVIVPKKTKNRVKIILICAIIALAYILSITFLPSAIIPTSSQMANNQSTPAFKLYFISLNKSQLEGSAFSLASDYQKLGAGGYAWKYEGYYHVVASCYEKENDAILVQNNIKVNLNLDSEIFAVDFPSLTIDEENESENKKVLNKALKSFYNTYQTLFDIAISLDTNVYNEISARLAVNNCYSNFSSICANFDTIFGDKEESCYQNILTYLQKGQQILQALCSAKPVNNGQTYSSLIKYRYLQILSSYYDFLHKF